MRELIRQTHDSLSNDDSSDKLRQFKFVEVNVANARESLDNNEIQFYIETLTGEAADKRPANKDETGKPAPGSRNAATVARLKGVPLLNIVYRGDRDASSNAQDRIASLLRLAR